MNTIEESGKIPASIKKKVRSSNLELLRILAMFTIVAHHSVVNSGIEEWFSFSEITPNMVFLQLWGMWGKTAINAFVLITGYFMCTSKLTCRRFIKMYLEVKFYRAVFFVIFVWAGYESLSLKSLFNLLFGNISGINGGFTSSFLAFYLFIPFMNLMIEKLGRDIWKLVLLLLGFFTVSATFFFNDVVFHHVFWYMTLYFVAAWIRLYPARWTQSTKFTGILLAVLSLLAIASVLCIDLLGYLLHLDKDWIVSYFMVSDSNKMLAFGVGMAAFLFFKNIKVKNNSFINGVASTTFGILLIHANSDAMRQWLWKDLFHVPNMYIWPFWQLIGAMVGIVIIVFIVCSILDYLRIFSWKSRFLDGLICIAIALKKM